MIKLQICRLSGVVIDGTKYHAVLSLDGKEFQQSDGSDSKVSIVGRCGTGIAGKACRYVRIYINTLTNSNTIYMSRTHTRVHPPHATDDDNISYNDTTSRLRLFTGYMPRLDPPSHSITNNRNVASQYSYLECETF